MCFPFTVHAGGFGRGGVLALGHAQGLPFPVPSSNPSDGNNFNATGPLGGPRDPVLTSSPAFLSLFDSVTDSLRK